MTKALALMIASAALAVSASLAVPAQAEGGVKIGVLTCSQEPGWGYIIGSSKELNCRFEPNNGPSEHYTGNVSKLGIDIGYTKGAVLTWAVFAPASNTRPGALQGTYGGVTASASIGAGIGANVLVGGFDRSLALQPLSVESLSGANLAAGIGAMELKWRG
jgi:uncharacterized protein DUF992